MVTIKPYCFSAGKLSQNFLELQCYIKEAFYLGSSLIVLIGGSIRGYRSSNGY